MPTALVTSFQRLYLLTIFYFRFCINIYDIQMISLRDTLEQNLNSADMPKAFLKWIMIFASLPIIMFFISIRVGSEFSNFQLFFRAYWMPAVIFEVITLFFALRIGWQPAAQFKELKSIIKIALLIWLSILFIGALFSAEIPAISMISVFLWILHLGFFGALHYIFKHWSINNQMIRFMALSLSLGSAITAFFIIIYSFIIGHGSDYDWISAMPGFSNIRHIGYIKLLGAALSLGAIISGYDKRTHVILFIINFAAIIWFGSRGPFIAILLSLLTAYIFIPNFRNIKKLGTILVSILSAILISQMVPTPPSPSYNVFDRYEEKKIDDYEKFTSGRSELWADAAQLFAKKPLIGNGTDQFKYTAESALGASRHPHNIIMQILFEWGLIGSLSFLFLIALLLNSVARDLFAARPEAVFLMPIMAAIFFSMIDGILFYALPISILSLIIVMQTIKARQ